MLALILLQYPASWPSDKFIIASCYVLFQTSFCTIQVNNNGVISFGAPVTAYTPNPFPLSGSSVLIAPYWADVDTFPSMGGFVHYRQTADPAVLNLARPHQGNFPLGLLQFHTNSSLYRNMGSCGILSLSH